jgi:hypothetical protein
MIEEDSARELDKATDDRLKKTGTITVLFHRVKNIRWPRAAGKKAPEKCDISHGVSKFGKVPEKSLKALGLSHHGGYIKLESETMCILIYSQR